MLKNIGSEGSFIGKLTPTLYFNKFIIFIIVGLFLTFLIFFEISNLIWEQFFLMWHRTTAK
jgi:predicted small integral membrane protein